MMFKDLEQRTCFFAVGNERKKMIYDGTASPPIIHTISRSVRFACLSRIFDGDSFQYIGDILALVGCVFEMFVYLFPFDYKDRVLDFIK
jgi:hypothetical protein